MVTQSKNVVNLRNKKLVSELIGKKVKVCLNNFKNIERTLREDASGLYILYKNKRIPVRPHCNYFGEFITGTFMGYYPFRKGEW